MSTRRSRHQDREVRSSSGYQLRIDGARCDAHGICVLRFAERIVLDEWGYAVVDLEPIVDRTDLKRARRAVAACPEKALELVAFQGRT